MTSLGFIFFALLEFILVLNTNPVFFWFRRKEAERERIALYKVRTWAPAKKGDRERTETAGVRKLKNTALISEFRDENNADLLTVALVKARA